MHLSGLHHVLCCDAQVEFDNKLTRVDLALCVNMLFRVFDNWKECHELRNSHHSGAQSALLNGAVFTLHQLTSAWWMTSTSDSHHVTLISTSAFSSR